MNAIVRPRQESEILVGEWINQELGNGNPQGIRALGTKHDRITSHNMGLILGNNTKWFKKDTYKLLVGCQSCHRAVENTV